MELKAALDRLNTQNTTDLWRDWQTTKGIDELSVVLSNPASFAVQVIELSITLWPVSIRFACARGNVDIEGESAAKSDGPAFHRAAELLSSVEARHRRFILSWTDRAGDQIASALMHHVLSIVDDWPRKAGEIARTSYYAPNKTHGEIAESFLISRQSVSQALARTRYAEILEAQTALTNWALETI